MIYDFIVIGAGIAGASAAFELAKSSQVLLIEAESQAGYHSSGRSAALFTRNYGSVLVRKVNALSEPFFQEPPKGFVDEPLIRPRGALAVAGPGDEAELNAVLALSTDKDPVVEMQTSDAVAMVPFLRGERVARAVFEAGVTDIEVATMLHAYLKGFKKRGGQFATDNPIKALRHGSGCWTVSTHKNTYKTKAIINAAGAWADEVGALAGASHIGLVAKRRTAIIVEATPGYDVGKLPCIDFTNGVYIKPDSGNLMASPGDAIPTTPQDVQAEEIDVAVLADWIQKETLLPVTRVSHRWAGLRSFVADDGPIVGYDALVPDFCWLAGQGGYGIMMAPALARAAASICVSQKLPSDFVKSGISLDELGPKRLIKIL